MTAGIIDDMSLELVIDIYNPRSLYNLVTLHDITARFEYNCITREIEIDYRSCRDGLLITWSVTLRLSQ